MTAVRYEETWLPPYQTSVRPTLVGTYRLDQTRLGRGQEFREHGEVIAAGCGELSAASMSMPITWPLGASRSWPWQASSTSQASCSCRLIKACSR